MTTRDLFIRWDISLLPEFSNTWGAINIGLLTD